MKFIFDIDGTILETTGPNDYEIKSVNEELVNIINELYSKNQNEIIIYTGRNWGLFEKTREQLKEIGLNYHSLICGKVPGLIIDDMSFRPLEFIEFYKKEDL